MSSRKKIAVIGAGPNGLVALKILREYGCDVVAFERQPCIGGLWKYQEEEGKVYASLLDRSHELSGCYESLVMNTSKRMSQFSDFPASDSFQTFLSHSEFLHYLEMYAEHFNLNDHIRFGCSVKKLFPVKIDSIGKWEVHYQKEGKMEVEAFDLVVVASGPFKHVRMPEYPGQKEFQGMAIHSAQIRQDSIFQNKRILMVGGSFSATEMLGIAIGSPAKSIYWTISDTPQLRNRWMFDRFPTPSEPIKAWDENITRDSELNNPMKFLSDFVSWLKPIYQREDDPQVRNPGDRLSITNTKPIEKALLSGRLKRVAPIKHFCGHSVLLADDTTLDNIDAVVFCTGFVTKFPFLDDIWDEKSQNELALYHHMIPTEKQLQGLAFVGTPYTLSALFPTTEIQVRWLGKFWASRECTPNCSLYTEEESEELRAAVRKYKASLIPGQPYNFIVDSYVFAENLAKEIGCQPPNSKELAINDRELALALLFGPLIAAQYRISGPHPWPEARDYVITVAREVLGPQKWQSLLNSYDFLK